MVCPNCGRAVERGDRFCNGCGTSLKGVTDTTRLVTTVADEAAEAAGEIDQIDEIDRIDEIDEIDEITVAGIDGTSVDQSSPDVASEDDRAPEDARTELLTITEDEEWDDDPDWARTGTVPAAVDGSEASTIPDEPSTGDLPATEPITEVWMSAEAEADEEIPSATPYDFTQSEVVEVTDTLPEQTGGTTELMPTVAPPTHPDHRHPSFGLITFISVVTGIVSLLAVFATIVTISSDVALTNTTDAPAGFRTGTWIADDLADNLSIAGLIAVVAMVVGGVASAFRWRWGSGLAGGAGLSMAGLAALTIGLAQFPIDAARQFARIPSEQTFVLTIDRDLGYWLLLAAGALGVVLFFASVNDAIGDRRSGLNPWIAALGALAVVVAAAGPLIPENQALLSDNWYLVEAPGEPSSLLLVGRLVQLGLLLAGGVIGFLSVRRWGLGAAIGASLPVIWLTISVLFELTSRPVGPAFRNPGADDMHIHGVTIIGVSAILAMAVLAVIAAYDQSARERP